MLLPLPPAVICFRYHGDIKSGSCILFASIIMLIRVVDGADDMKGNYDGLDNKLALIKMMMRIVIL